MGFSNVDASCVPENFPNDLVITGAADTGYTVSSAWYGAFPVAFNGNQWTGSGPALDGFANTCGGNPNTTTVTITFNPTQVVADDTTGTLAVAQIQGTVTLDSPETPDCVQATRVANFVTAAG